VNHLARRCKGGQKRVDFKWQPALTTLPCRDSKIKYLLHLALDDTSIAGIDLPYRHIVGVMQVVLVDAGLKATRKNFVRI
jgi:hypothetical protein